MYVLQWEREREREREFNGMTVCDSENEWMYLVHVSERDRELVSLKCGLFTAFIRLDVDYARRLVSLHVSQFISFTAF